MNAEPSRLLVSKLAEWVAPILAEAIEQMILSRGSDAVRDGLMSPSGLMAAEQIEIAGRKFTWRLSLDVEDDGPVECVACGGTGDGQVDGTICRRCRGSGNAGGA